MDMTYIDYNDQIAASLADEILSEKIRNTKPLGLFSCGKPGQWEPHRHAGYTLITPTFEDESENLKTYVKLGDAQQFFLRKLNPALYIPAPISAFHLTVARLVSGSDYEEQIVESREEDFIKRLSREFNLLPRFESIKMAIRGVSIIADGVIAALAIPFDESEYRRLLSFRTQLYTNEALKDFKVQPQRPFVGHITLAYIEAALTLEDQRIMFETIRTINRLFFKTALPFQIARAEVRKFHNYLRFFREPDWPVYLFT